MKVAIEKIVKLLVILLFVVVFICSLIIWAGNSPIVDDYRWIHKRDTELGLVAAFSTALRVNHPIAYDMIDPALEPRLDEWMGVHQSKKCIYQADYFSIWSGTKDGKRVSFGCAGENNRWFTFEVDNIIVKNMKVIDWGEVVEVEE